MRLTVLGRYAPFARVGGACSGYLLQHAGTNILLEAGNGVFARLQQHINHRDLTAVVLSHLHNDHVADVHGMRYAVRGSFRDGTRQTPLPVYAPSEPAADFRALTDEVHIDMREIRPGMSISIGTFELSFVAAAHPMPCLAMSFLAGERRLVYTGDTGWDQGLIEFARNADLLLAEASLNDGSADMGPKLGHLTAREVGQMAKQAGARKALLTHLWPEFSFDGLLAEAREVFPKADLAEEGRVYAI
jgi:ribonuclease BN (tRNA processing enzyme)